MAGHVDQDRVGGLAWLATRGDDLEVGVAGHLTRGEPRRVQRDSLFRISSMTKPITAVGALVLIEECRIRLDDPVDDLLPELADRRVLVDGRGPLDGETVPARRPITVRDLLTFRLGLGMDFEAPWPQPLLDAMAELDLEAGPPEPQVPPEPDEWMRSPGSAGCTTSVPTCSACSWPGPRASRWRTSCASGCSSRWGWSTPGSPPGRSTG
jgi:CubicO group peptidase (beta-lactamase class C family)